ncbi:VirB8 family type IV secretion system protein [Helicobacter trogontum]|uniref:Virulence protein n=1 Tax=Helicobacter trogontum TaxID=50960 RepID=A0A099VCG6_9HELI|nr:VirB8/TrbF family protein [Helicobacter trogontum]TLD84670.1 virulence protein [Helicobacter trogontum]
MAFDDRELKTDPNYIFRTERNIKAIMFLWILILSVIVVLLIVGFFILLPLKQKEPYLVFFSNADTNFVRVEQGNYNIRADEALLKSIIATYLLNRETINRIDDIERYEKIRLQSSKEVWEVFETIVKQEGSIYQEKDLYRNIKIINLSILSKNVANIDFITETKNGNSNKTMLKRYRATLQYDFINQELSFDSVPENPSGFIVTGYALTEIFDDK